MSALPITRPITRPVQPLGFHYRHQQLQVEYCSIKGVVEHLANILPTPFYCYSKATLLANIERCQSAFKGAADEDEIAEHKITRHKIKSRAIDIHYAMKANCNLSLLALMAEQGLGVDIVSAGELKRAQAAGFSADKMIFSGVGKSRAELIQAIDCGIGQINVESVEELGQLAKLTESLAKPITVALRVNPEVSVDTHAGITTGQRGNKFGIEMEHVIPLFQRYADHRWINLSGLAMHIGSQICELTPYRVGLDTLMRLTQELQALGLEVSSLDVGGGFGVEQRLGLELGRQGDLSVNQKRGKDDSSSLSFAAVAKVIRAATSGFSGKVCVEPGRSLVADTGILVSSIHYVKEASPRPFVILDAGMNDLMRPALYQAEHPLLAVNRSAANSPPATEQQSMRDYDVVGPVCESTDTFNRGYALKTDLKADDLMAFFNVGAYCAVMSSGYNSRSVIGEVLVDGDEIKVIRQCLGQDKLMALEQL